MTSQTVYDINAWRSWEKYILSKCFLCKKKKKKCKCNVCCGKPILIVSDTILLKIIDLKLVDYKLRKNLVGPLIKDMIWEQLYILVRKIDLKSTIKEQSYIADTQPWELKDPKTLAQWDN